MKESQDKLTPPIPATHCGAGASPDPPQQLSQSHMWNSAGALPQASSPGWVPQHGGCTGGYLTPEQVWEVQTPREFWCSCCSTSIFPDSSSWERLGHLAFHKH